MPDTRLVLFARYPSAGACKTRLIPALGAAEAADLRRCLTERTNERGFEISAFGRNIFNDTSILGAIDFNNFAAFVEEPAVYRVEMRKRF